ncbi:MAG: FAD-dependent oxidoreductase, partial [Ornithinimicrobium sp.]
MSTSQPKAIVIGSGPGGYEAALTAAHLGCQVYLVEREGIGGAAVLTDCVPSKALIATADFMDRFTAARRIGVQFDGAPENQGVTAHVDDINTRVMDLARAQSADITERLEGAGVEIVT